GRSGRREEKTGRARGADSADGLGGRAAEAGAMDVDVPIHAKYGTADGLSCADTTTDAIRSTTTYTFSLSCIGGVE
ncbi:unnamed protein product, partial [Urochloa humidicola]